MDGVPIGDYALLSDCRSAALVSRAGSVDWLCFPRFDAPSVFCRLLDPAGGRFAIRPAGDFRASRAYLDQTMVLETTFRAEAGTAVLTDALAVGRNDRGHHLGAGSPGSAAPAGVHGRRAGGRRHLCPASRIRPHSPDSGGGPRRSGRAGRRRPAPAFRTGQFPPRRGHRHRAPASDRWPDGDFALQHGQMQGPRLEAWDASQMAERLEDTVAGWRSWSAIHQTYEGPGATWSTIPAGCCRRSRSHRPAPSSPRPPPRCRRPSGGSGTGITGIPGCAMPA